MTELTQTQPGGRFTFENVPPGEYVLWVPPGGTRFARYPESIVVERGRELRIVLGLAASPRVSR